MLARLLLVVFAALLVGCDPDAERFNNVDITGASYARDFRLTDFNGQPRTLADFRGKVVVMFFGYTQCPDVCPTTMTDMAEVKRRLGPDGERVQVIFVTLDPDRDTAEVLSQYVPGFDPSFLGLRRHEGRDRGDRQGLQGLLPEGARQDRDVLHDGPHGRQLRLRHRGTGAAVPAPCRRGRSDRR